MASGAEPHHPHRGIDGEIQQERWAAALQDCGVGKEHEAGKDKNQNV